MSMIYVALMGAEGENGYRPIMQGSHPIPGAAPFLPLAFLRTYFRKSKRYCPTEIKPCDCRVADAALAWGYGYACQGDNGYVFWLSEGTRPRTTPDLRYAWWLKPHEVKAIREKYLKPPVEDQPDTRTEHPHRRTDGMTYQLEDKEKIKNRCAELLSERGIVCAETVRVVLGIHGDSLDTLNDILEHETGENDIMDYFADELEAAGLVSRDDEQEDDDEDTGSDE